MGSRPRRLEEVSVTEMRGGKGRFDFDCGITCRTVEDGRCVGWIFSLSLCVVEVEVGMNRKKCMLRPCSSR